MDVGRRIKEAREEAGMTQAELGERVGVAMNTVYRWERGSFHPNIVMFQRIATATDKPLGFFFDSTEAA